MYVHTSAYVHAYEKFNTDPKCRDEGFGLTY